MATPRSGDLIRFHQASWQFMQIVDIRNQWYIQRRKENHEECQVRCSFCGKNEATFRVEQAKGEEHSHHWICVGCAQMAGIMTELPPRMPRPADLFEELLFGQEGDEEAVKLCATCGTSYRDMRSSGRLGCPDCYTVFHDEVTELVGGGDPDHAYCGAMPARIEPYKTFYIDREALRRQLQTALQEERYEEAAHLRDAIRVMDGRGAS